LIPDQWIEHYRRAWETAGADEVADLFIPDASYRSSVFREPYLGGDTLHQYWRRRQLSATGWPRRRPRIMTGRAARDHAEV
jgi:hypothetical protein